MELMRMVMMLEFETLRALQTRQTSTNRSIRNRNRRSFYAFEMGVGMGMEMG